MAFGLDHRTIESIATNYSGSAASELPKEQREIDREMQRLNHAIDVCGEVAKDLCERIGAVLGPDTPSPETKTSDSLCMTGLGNQIASMSRTVDAYSESLRRIIARLAL